MTDAGGPSNPDIRTNEELVSATGKGLRWITYTRIAVEVMTLASMVVLARLIPPAAFGIFAVAVIVQELALSVPGEGVGSALVQRRAVDKRHWQGGLAVCLLLGGVMGGLTILLAFALVEPIFGRDTAMLVVLASPCFALGALMAVPMARLRRDLNFARISQIELAGTMIRLVATLALALAGLDAGALVIGNLVGFVAALALCYVATTPQLPRWHAREIRELLTFGGPASLASIAWAGFRNGDYAVINVQLGATQAGLYWRAYQLAVEHQKKVSVVMTQLAFPVLARTAGDEEMLTLRRRMTQLLTVTLFPALLLLVLLAPTLVPWLFGPLWEPAVLPTQILAIGGATTLVIDAIGPALMAAGRARALLGYGVAHFAIYIGAVVLVSSKGLIAVAIAASVIHGAFMLVAYQVMLGGRGGRALRAIVDDLAPATISCAALIAVAAPLTWALDPESMPTLVYLLAVTVPAGAAYLGALRLIFRATAADLAAMVNRVMPAQISRALAALRFAFVVRRSSSETG